MLRIFLVFFMILKISYGYINIYPSFFYKQLTKDGASETFILTNRSNKKVGYRIYFESEEKDTNIKGEVFPKNITLDPLEKKEFKVLLTPNEKNISGEFSKTLTIKEISVPKEEKKKVYSKLKLKLSVYTENLKAKLENKFFIENEQLILNLKNSGNRLGIFEIYALKDNEWIYLDKFILKSLEQDIKKYKYLNYQAIKIIEINDNSIVLHQKLKGKTI